MSKKIALFFAFVLVSSAMVFAQGSLDYSRTLMTEEGGYQWYKLEGNGKLGAQSRDGRTIVPMDYYSSIMYHKGWFYVKANGSEGAYSPQGEYVIPLSRGYSFICFHKEEGRVGYFGAQRGNKEGACDMTGKEVLPIQYADVIYSTSEDRFKYKDNSGEWHVTDIRLDANGRAVGGRANINNGNGESGGSANSRNGNNNNGGKRSLGDRMR